MKVLDVLSGPLADILDKFVSDKDLKTKLNHELELELHRANIAQLEINKVEAAQSLYLFRAGDRHVHGCVQLHWVITLSYNQL